MSEALADLLSHPRALEPRLAARAGSIRVAHLVNIIHPADRPIYLELAHRVGHLRTFVCSPLGLHGVEKSDWEGLDVCRQRTLTVRRPQRHPLRFAEWNEVHLPWDTMGRLKAFRPEAIFAHEAGVRSALSAVYARRFGVPLVVSVGMTEHTEGGRGWSRLLLRRWLLRRADVVAVNGVATARYVLGLGAQRQRLQWTPYATLPQASAAAPARREPAAAHRLLYVGQLIERKGLAPFFAALGRWAEAHRQREVEFWLIGSGPLEGALRGLPMPANVRLRWFGRLRPQEIAAHYAQAGIFAFPTLADEWGLVVNEAMASGLPVLGSLYSQAVEELCETGVTGWTFRPDHPREMDQAIAAALETSPEQLDAMRPAARERVRPLTAAFAAERMHDAIVAAMANFERRKR